MPTIDNDKFYLNALKRYGHTPKGLNWSNKHSQQIRFEIILELLQKYLTAETTLIDAGCGFGDFYIYLQKKGININYIGYDVLEKFVNIAKMRTGQKCYKRDILIDELEEADFYIASGSLNILTKFETIFFIQRCFEHSKKGFVFNLLQTSQASEFFNICNKDEIIKFGKELGAKVSIRVSYLPEDFTLFFQK